MEEQKISVFDELAETQPYFEYATTGQRFLNFLTDMVIYYLLNFILFFVLTIILILLKVERSSIHELMRNKLFTLSISMIVGTAYFTLSEGASKGKTIGKLLTRTKAVNEDLTPINWKTAFYRSLSRFVPFEVFSGLSGYPWHDKWTRTHVIKNIEINI